MGTTYTISILTQQMQSYESEGQGPTMLQSELYIAGQGMWKRLRLLLSNITITVLRCRHCVQNQCSHQTYKQVNSQLKREWCNSLHNLNGARAHKGEWKTWNRSWKYASYWEIKGLQCSSVCENARDYFLSCYLQKEVLEDKSKVTSNEKNKHG